MNNNRAFTLFEAILALTITVIMATGLVALLFSQHKEALPQVYSYTSAYGTNDYALIPSGAQFRRAAVLVSRLQDSIDSASAVFVLGGFRSTPSTDESAGRLAPLTAGCLIKTVTSITSSKIPQTSYDLRTNFLSSVSGVTYETSSDASDFTIITISGLNTVSSITQVRRYSPSSVNGESVVLYEVVYDDDLTSSRIESADSANQNRFSYRIALPSQEDANWTLRPGAMHYWFRHDTTWTRYEEAPARVIFPDPFLLAGASSQGDTVPFSRLIFFLAPTS